MDFIQQTTWMSSQPGGPTHTEINRMDLFEFYATYSHLVTLHEQRVENSKR